MSGPGDPLAEAIGECVEGGAGDGLGHRAILSWHPSEHADSAHATHARRRPKSPTRSAYGRGFSARTTSQRTNDISAHEPDLVDLLAEERHHLVAAIGDESVAGVEAVRPRVVGGDPEVDGVIAHCRVEELLADARAVVGIEQVEEVELAFA